jgi:parallel beta-helix repeat protein
MRRSRGKSWGRRRLVASLAVGCVVLALQAAPAVAVPAPVLYVGGSGCSDAGTGTQAQPYCTISAAAAVAVGGQTVQVASGSYPEHVRPAHSGASTAPLAFTAAPGATPVVTGADHAFDLSYRSYVTVSGFTSSATTSSGIYLKSSDHITVAQNLVTTAGQPVAGYTAYGIYLSATTDSVVRGNVTYGNSNAGIYLTAGTTRVTVDGNESFGNANGYQRAATGIDIRSPGNTITRNRTHNNEDTGIQAYPGGDNNLIAGNASYDNKGFTTVPESNCDRPLSGASGCITGDHGIDDYGTYANTITGNTVYNNVSAGINVEGVTATWLTTAIGAADSTVPVGSAQGFPTAGAYTIQVDGEQMTVIGGQGTTTWTVTRGANGTTAAAHAAGCDGTSCSPKNLNVVQQAGFSLENNVSVDNAINCPDGNGGVQTACNRTKGEIRVDQYSWLGTSANRNVVWTSSTAYTYVYTWGNPTYKTLAALTSATGQEAGGTQANPLWADSRSHDFHLTSGSPAIDSADSNASGELTTDATGAPRDDDPATTDTGVGARTYDDRGAYEFQPTGSPSPSPTPTSPSPTPTSPTPTASSTPGPTASSPSPTTTPPSPTTTSPSPTVTSPTPLTLYFTDTSTPTLSGARKMVPTVPAAETSHQNVIGTATGWGSIYPGGNSSAWPAAGSEPAVNTHGFLYDTTALAGVTLAAGSYAPNLKVKVAVSGVSASFTTRVWLRHSNGTFTLLAKYQSSTVALTSTAQTIVAWSEVQAQTATTTTTGDLLFLDVAADILTNTAGSGTNAITMALNGGAAESLVTPGYTTAGAGS